jgi:hypothetical protein
MKRPTSTSTENTKTSRPLMEPGPPWPRRSEYEEDEADTEKMLRTLDQIIAKRKREGKAK